MKFQKLLIVPLALAVLALGSFSTASAQVASPKVALQFATNGLTNPLTAGSDNAVIARLLLDTTGSTEAVRISSLPFNLITGSGANASTLENCRVYNESDNNDALNSGTGSLSSGVNNIALSDALVLSANSLTTLSLRCDIDSDLVSGGTYTVNMNTANVVATGASTGVAAMVTVRGSIVVPPVIITPPVTPGMPSTGAAGVATQTFAMIALSLIMAGVGFSVMSKRSQS